VESSKIMGIRKWHTVARDQKKWRRTVLEAKVNNGLKRLRTRRERKRNDRFQEKMLKFM
jgi:hypothetical protein